MMCQKESSARASTIRCFGLVLIATIAWQTNYATAFSVSDTSAKTSISSSSFASHRIASTESNRHTLRMSANSNNDDDNCNEPLTTRRITGRKRALLRKYGKAVALSTTLLYGPMASIPSARASTTAATKPGTGSDYKFKDFKDIKMKLSLAPGADVENYEEILAKVEVEGEAALEEQKKGAAAAALTIGDSGEDEGGEATSSGIESGTKKGRRASKRAQRKKQKKSQVSEWESDEFGFGEDDDEDYDSGVLSFDGSSSAGASNSPSKKSKSGGDPGTKGDGGGDVVLTDKMAFNNYKAKLSQEEKTKIIKKGAFYSIFPVFVITMIRGQVRAWKEKKWVKKGLAIKEEEFQSYLEEKKKKKEGKGDDDDDDDDWNNQYRDGHTDDFNDNQENVERESNAEHADPVSDFQIQKLREQWAAIHEKYTKGVNRINSPTNDVDRSNARTNEALKVSSAIVIPSQIGDAGPRKGRGIFATEPIPKGTLVIDWGNGSTAFFKAGHHWREFVVSLPRETACNVIEWSWVQNIPPEGENDDDVRIGRTIFVAFDESNLLNSADWDDVEANLRCGRPPEREGVERGPCGFHYYAARDIAEGEELLIDYREFVDLDPTGFGWDQD
mmetsp:Transcript_41173/g.86356  ORF Transcript_41173/g.86356 Transcript_41173/m.86356 type:complete len:616 (+) Transcript_41173:209-2056(+)